MDAEFGLIIPFLDDSQSFALGFGCGEMMGMLKLGHTPYQQLTHKANIDQLKLIAKHFKTELIIENESDEWCEVTFIDDWPEATSIPARPKLEVVK